MSRSYRTLAAALVAMLLLVGVAQLVKSDDEKGSVTAAQVASTVADAGTAPAADGTQPVTDVVDGDVATTSSLAPPITADCTITEVLKVGASGAAVQCLESQLAAAGYSTTIDTTFDAVTDSAVKAYQASLSLEVDGIVGRQTAQTMGIWAGPLGPMPATDDDCPSTPHGVIVDRANQRGALCENGSITYEFPITTAWSQPDPGTYPVYAKDLNASSNITGQYSTMTHFVAFTRGKYQGARIAFHSMPKYSNGQYLQPLDSVGKPEMHGESSGCIRLKPDDAIRVWDWLSIDDEVRVIS